MATKRKKNKGKHRRFKRFKLSEISGVDRPAQEPALAAIMKNEDGGDMTTEQLEARIAELEAEIAALNSKLESDDEDETEKDGPSDDELKERLDEIEEHAVGKRDDWIDQAQKFWAVLDEHPAALRYCNDNGYGAEQQAHVMKTWGRPPAEVAKVSGAEAEIRKADESYQALDEKLTAIAKKWLAEDPARRRYSLGGAKGHIMESGEYPEVSLAKMMEAEQRTKTARATAELAKTDHDANQRIIKAHEAEMETMVEEFCLRHNVEPHAASERMRKVSKRYRQLDDELRQATNAVSVARVVAEKALKARWMEERRREAEAEEQAAEQARFDAMTPAQKAFHLYCDAKATELGISIGKAMGKLINERDPAAMKLYKAIDNERR